MKICKITAKSDQDIAILVKRGKDKFVIAINQNNHITINGYETDFDILEDVAHLQFYSQRIEQDLLDNITDFKDIDEASFMQDEEE